MSRQDRASRFLFQEALALSSDSPEPIVEIGAIRDRSTAGAAADGHSTLAWLKGCGKREVFCFDLDPKAIDLTTRLCGASSQGRLKLFQADGLEALRHWKLGQPSLLYLDGPAPTVQGQYWHRHATSLAIKVVKPLVVLIDDCDFSDLGKGSLAIPLLLQRQYRLVETNIRQFLFKRL